MHIIIAFFVLSYIAFDVLDLDLSAFPLQQAAHKQALIVAEAPGSTESTYLLDYGWLSTNRSFEEAPVIQPSIRFSDNRVLKITSFRIARAQIYRVIYPPSSSPDPDSSPA
jgi:hypothetical protein